MSKHIKPRVVIVDQRNGPVRADGSNIDLPPEGQESALRSIERADVLVQVHQDGIYVKEGADTGWVLLLATKSEATMSAEKAERDLSLRDKPNDDLEKGDHPIEVKFARVWQESGSSGTERLKGY